LQHLPTYGDYLVPFTVEWIDGKPDFRVINRAKIIECGRDKLCGVCGHKLGEFCWFIGGELCKENHIFVDPPMHEECARFTAATCPFVKGDRCEYSDRPVKAGENKIAIHPMANSGSMYLLKARTRFTRLASHPVQGFIFAAWRNWQKIEEI
jgi:hypothetical protein